GRAVEAEVNSVRLETLRSETPGYFAAESCSDRTVDVADRQSLQDPLTAFQRRSGKRQQAAFIQTVFDGVFLAAVLSRIGEIRLRGAMQKRAQFERAALRRGGSPLFRALLPQAVASPDHLGH